MCRGAELGKRELRSLTIPVEGKDNKVGITAIARITQQLFAIALEQHLLQDLLVGCACQIGKIAQRLIILGLYLVEVCRLPASLRHNIRIVVGLLVIGIYTIYYLVGCKALLVNHNLDRLLLIGLRSGLFHLWLLSSVTRYNRCECKQIKECFFHSRLLSIIRFRANRYTKLNQANSICLKISLILL